MILSVTSLRDMRVLFVSTFGHGHVFPLIPLALACQEAGHDVLWAANGPAVSLVELAGIRCAEAGLSGQALATTVSRLQARAGQLAPADRAAFMFPTMFGETLSPPMAADLLPLARDFQPDLLAHEQGELASPLVAEVLGVPSLTHSFGGAAPAAFIAEAGQRLAGFWQEHGLTQHPYAGCYSAPYLDICPPSVQTVSLSHIRLVQPLQSISWSGPAATFEPTDDARPLVYVTLGTVASNPAVLREALAGLACLDVQVLVTVGPMGEPDALGPQPAHVRVERFVPQTRVLPHVSVVLLHGGSGTFLGGSAAVRRDPQPTRNHLNPAHRREANPDLKWKSRTDRPITHARPPTKIIKSRQGRSRTGAVDPGSAMLAPAHFPLPSAPR